MKRPDRAIKWLTTLATKYRGTGHSVWGLMAVLKYVEYLEGKLREIEEEWVKKAKWIYNNLPDAQEEKGEDGK